MLGVERLDNEVLLEIGVAASVLLDGGLLESMLIGKVGGDLDIGIVLSQVLFGGGQG